MRVRFAPSPTGALHIGGVRTALYNYLLAKKNGGDFILRIEDTDSQRFVPGAEEYILETFKWLGLPFDEGVGIGGPYAPYHQSQRKEIYRKYVDELLSKDLAYYAFDTPEDLEAMRKDLEAAKSSSLQYDASTRMKMRNTLTMSKEEVSLRLDSGEAYVVRIKIDPGESIIVHDLIRGEVKVQSDLLDDKVLYKSADGLPTYHLANIVDDHLMKITHVIRGEEWLPSAPLHVLLYRYLGWADSMPTFSHLPLLLKPDGNGKLSKRDGDRLGFPVFPLEWKDPKTGEISPGYREKGYFPQAVINMLAFLGWNPGTEQEIFSLAQLTEAFSLDRVSKSGAKFNPEKAAWFNQQYLQTMSDADLLPLCLQVLKKHGIAQPQEEIAARVLSLLKERMQFPEDFWQEGYFFFESPKEYDAKTVEKRWDASSSGIMKAIADIIDSHQGDVLNLEEKVKEYMQKENLGMGKVMNAFRLCLVGAGKGPHLFDIVDIIGYKESADRLRKACGILK